VRCWECTSDRKERIMGWDTICLTLEESDESGNLLDILDAEYVHATCLDSLAADRGIVADDSLDSTSTLVDGTRYVWGLIPAVDEQDSDTYCAHCGDLMSRGLEWYEKKAALDAAQERAENALETVRAALDTLPEARTALDDALVMLRVGHDPSPYDALDVLDGIIMEWDESARDALGAEYRD
jgi:PAS domain-containing protein